MNRRERHIKLLVATKRELPNSACSRCKGNGYTGHMGTGHDVCPICGGIGQHPGDSLNLVRLSWDLYHAARELLELDIDLNPKVSEEG